MMNWIAVALLTGVGASSPAQLRPDIRAIPDRPTVDVTNRGTEALTRGIPGEDEAAIRPVSQSPATVADELLAAECPPAGWHVSPVTATEDLERSSQPF